MDPPPKLLIAGKRNSDVRDDDGAGINVKHDEEDDKSDEDEDAKLGEEPKAITIEAEGKPVARWVLSDGRDVGEIFAAYKEMAKGIDLSVFFSSTCSSFFSLDVPPLAHALLSLPFSGLPQATSWKSPMQRQSVLRRQKTECGMKSIRNGMQNGGTFGPASKL